MLETDDAIACSYISWSKMDYGLCDTRGRKRKTQTAIRSNGEDTIDAG